MTCDALSKVGDCRFCYTTTWYHLTSYVHQTIQEGSCSNYNSLCSDFCTPDSLHTNSLSVFYDEFVSLVLPYFEMRCSNETIEIETCQIPSWMIRRRSPAK